MRFQFTPEEESFRQDVRAFLKREWNEDMESLKGSVEWWEVERTMRKKLAQKGWLALSWPRKYGGSEATAMQQGIFADEWGYAQAPGRDSEGVGYIGPAIMVHGTEEQKHRHLLDIARGNVVWCQGYSEPEAGSDLASLKTRAVLEGDHWIINGQKIWTSQAHHAHWILLLARTDLQAPKHKGITIFIAPMSTPGITVRPIVDMTAGHYFNETFFDNVKVPRENVIGEINRGWYAAMTLLDFERPRIHETATARRCLDETIRFARETRVNGRPIIGEPRVRHMLADLAVQVETAYLFSWRTIWLQSQGQAPNKEASVDKLFSSETQQKAANVAMSVLGLHGQLTGASRHTPLHGFLQRFYLYCRAVTIMGGTSEIQRNIISTRGLSLPRQ